jgi:hypothetical protein
MNFNSLQVQQTNSAGPKCQGEVWDIIFLGDAIPRQATLVAHPTAQRIIVCIDL